MMNTYTWKVPEEGFKINWVMRFRERLASGHSTHLYSTLDKTR